MVALSCRFATIALSACLALTNTHAHSQERNPLNYLSLVEAPRIETPSHRVHAHSHFDLTFDLHNGRQRIKLTLEPNHDIIPEGATVEYLDADGRTSRVEPILRHAHKVFKGHTWVEDEPHHWSNVGWSRIVIRRDGIHPLFEGVFTVMHDNHHIQLHSNYLQTKHELDPHVEAGDTERMVLFRGTDVDKGLNQELKRSTDTSPASCMSDQMEFNMQPNHPVYQNYLRRDAGLWGSLATTSLFGKRAIDNNGIPKGGGNSGGVNLKGSIGQTIGCPSQRRVALVGVALDCSYLASFNSSDAARQNVITQMNSASNLYESSFNITLGLHNLTVTDANCPGTAPPSAPWNIPCSDSVTIQDRLNLFSTWRGTKADTNSHWTLLTKCNTGAAVGLAWLGQACISNADGSQGNETTTGANVVARTSTEWQVIAHETGHTFGAVHDCTSETCADGNTVNSQQCCPLSSNSCDAGQKYIMNPSTGDGITAFSPCTIGNICSALGRNSVKSDCLTANKGVVLISGQQCGNGIVEDGEDCDCGGEESCGNNQCCDPKTCKFKTNAVCDDSNETCCQGCQFAPSSLVCRSSTGQCDPEEKCSGNSPTCPGDIKEPDGKSCGNASDKLTCASGQCTSRDLQCKTLMGSFTTNNDTYACDQNDCQLSCASPQFGANSCYGMQQNFLDGTACGGGGKCLNGRCTGSSDVKAIGSWISRNKPLVIGIGSAIGALFLISILSCIWRCISSSRAKRRHRKANAHGARHRKTVSPVWQPGNIPHPSVGTQGGGAGPPRQLSGAHVRMYGGYSDDASHYWQPGPVAPAAYAPRAAPRYA